MLDLNALMLFHEVVKGGSLTAACERLDVPRSTLSRRLLQLEKDLGTLLLKKSTRKLAPTDLGLAVHEHCARIASATKELGVTIEDVSGMTVLPEFLHLISRARMVMSVDGAASHLARAMNVPSLTMHAVVSLPEEDRPRPLPLPASLTFRGRRAGNLRGHGFARPRFRTLGLPTRDRRSCP